MCVWEISSGVNARLFAKDVRSVALSFQHQADRVRDSRDKAISSGTLAECMFASVEVMQISRRCSHRLPRCHAWVVFFRFVFRQ